MINFDFEELSTRSPVLSIFHKAGINNPNSLPLVRGPGVMVILKINLNNRIKPEAHYRSLGA